MNFKDDLKARSGLVEAYLESCLESIEMPAGLRQAMNYSLLAGGKRIRPVLCLSSAALFGLDFKTALPFAAGIECIHSYSLIHDDLPAMDDDDFRRGRPSNHKQFGEATAILAGDALVTDAFVFMSRAALESGGSIPADNALRALHAVALAAGSHGMVGGQFLDMEYTARRGVVLEELAAMQAAKTGALLSVSCHSGAILAGADADGCRRLAAYGSHLGKAFQIVDDILDETGDPEVMGKPVGSDAAQGKVTYPSLLGLEESARRARQSGDAALAELQGYSGPDAEFLRGLIEYILKRAS
ncbi:polyprenyl synthetase family protein [Desulfovibrio sp. OttesenSCG-928-C14]|nr:polyprenyl synthetase family protein [Desulfovibrio sp. OttesenSCG-928-C14]